MTVERSSVSLSWPGVPRLFPCAFPASVGGTLPAPRARDRRDRPLSSPSSTSTRAFRCLGGRVRSLHEPLLHPGGRFLASRSHPVGAVSAQIPPKKLLRGSVAPTPVVPAAPCVRRPRRQPFRVHPGDALPRRSLQVDWLGPQGQPGAWAGATRQPPGDPCPPNV